MHDENCVQGITKVTGKLYQLPLDSTFAYIISWWRYFSQRQDRMLIRMTMSDFPLFINIDSLDRLNKYHFDWCYNFINWDRIRASKIIRNRERHFNFMKALTSEPHHFLEFVCLIFTSCIKLNSSATEIKFQWKFKLKEKINIAQG